MEQRFPLLTDGTLVVKRGAWASGNNYETGNIVNNTGTYYCKAPHTSAAATEPGVGVDWATVWEPFVVVTGTYESSYFKADSEVPYLRLIDGSDNDIMIRLNAGVLEFYDNGNSVSYEKTDYQVAVDHLNAAFSTSGATWTASESTNALISTRTAAAADHYRSFGPIQLPQRTASGKGAKLTSVKVAYTVGGTIDTANDILSVNLIAQTLPADGSGASASVIAGDDEADLDTDHNTNAKRLGAGSHTLIVTIPVGEQAYAADGKAYFVRLRVKDASTANMTFVLNGIVANYAAAEY